jgi:hypothetical protein
MTNDGPGKENVMTVSRSRTASTVLLPLLLCIASPPLWAGIEGITSTAFGYSSGHTRVDFDNGADTFLGAWSGYFNTGFANTFVGYYAGYNNATGHGNVFLGNGAGTSELGSDRLYIDNCRLGSLCDAPFIYGEFDNHLLKINGVTHIAADGVAKSQMHFSLDMSDSGGFLTSASENNFFVSSGARFDGTLAAPNQWVQRASDGKSVIAGSGLQGYRIFTGSSHAVGSSFSPSIRLHINYAGEFGINQASVAGHEIHTSSGAYLAGGTWTNASSRDLKDNIRELSTEAAAKTLAALNPVTFNYKADGQWQHVGFIAEDVPDLVASPDRKGLSPMDIVAVLTKVVQEQKQALETQKQLLDEKSRALEDQKREVAQMKEQLSQLSAEVRRLAP